jgi:hypothetical protein
MNATFWLAVIGLTWAVLFRFSVDKRHRRLVDSVFGSQHSKLLLFGAYAVTFSTFAMTHKVVMCGAMLLIIQALVRRDGSIETRIIESS